MTELRAHAPEATRVRRYRPELQGLRAVAVLLVVVYHVWLGRISGGVDVFFLISGFLVTGQLFRAGQRGRVEFAAQWGRTLRRLVPTAAVVLLATAAAGVLLLPENRWFDTIREIVAALLFAENWKLIADSADYYAQHDGASVVQHFWSLSIQGQFYFVWPLLVAGVVALARFARSNLRTTLALTLLGVFAASFVFSIWLTAADQPQAYFHSLTRVWEFALGGLLALAIDAIRLPRPLRIALGWLGILGLLACGMVLPVGSSFPGYLALWPLLSATAVLVAGATGSRFGADRLLATRPMSYLGDLSYSLYLWHWPILVFYLVSTGQPAAGLRGGVGIIAVALALSALTYHLVEKRTREPRGASRWSGYRFAALAMVPVLLFTLGWQLTGRWKADSYATVVGDPDHPGALALTPGFEYWGAEDVQLAPAFVALADEFATMGTADGAGCAIAERHSELEICTTGFTEPPSRRIVVAGDSHSQQFVAALRPVAEQRNWQIQAMVRGGCPFSTDSDTVPGDQSCVDWNSAVADEIIAQRPDAVFTIGTRDVRVGVPERTPPGYVAQWRKISDVGIPVLAVRDNPRFDFSPSACVESLGVTAPECSTPRADLLAPEPPYALLADRPPNVSFLDFSDYFCGPALCPPVVGNVLLYLDDNHVTATYMSTMSTIVASAVESALGWETPAG